MRNQFIACTNVVDVARKNDLSLLFSYVQVCVWVSYRGRVRYTSRILNYMRLMSIHDRLNVAQDAFYMVYSSTVSAHF